MFRCVFFVNDHFEYLYWTISIAQCSFFFVSVFFVHLPPSMVFRLTALSGQIVDYCRYGSYSPSKEGHLYVFQC